MPRKKPKKRPKPKVSGHQVGWMAAMQGRPLEDNPFLLGTIKRETFTHGWQGYHEMIRLREKHAEDRLEAIRRAV